MSTSLTYWTPKGFTQRLLDIILISSIIIDVTCRTIGFPLLYADKNLLAFNSFLGVIGISIAPSIWPFILGAIILQGVVYTTLTKAASCYGKSSNSDKKNAELQSIVDLDLQEENLALFENKIGLIIENSTLSIQEKNDVLRYILEERPIPKQKRFNFDYIKQLFYTTKEIDLFSLKNLTHASHIQKSALSDIIVTTIKENPDLDLDLFQQKLLRHNLIKKIKQNPTPEKLSNQILKNLDLENLNFEEIKQASPMAIDFSSIISTFLAGGKTFVDVVYGVAAMSALILFFINMSSTPVCIAILMFSSISSFINLQEQASNALNWFKRSFFNNHTSSTTNDVCLNTPKKEHDYLKEKFKKTIAVLKTSKSNLQRTKDCENKIKLIIENINYESRISAQSALISDIQAGRKQLPEFDKLMLSHAKLFPQAAVDREESPHVLTSTTGEQMLRAATASPLS